MHIPTCTQNLKTQTQPRIFLGLQGEPGTGKTTSALTFPNPIVLDLDGGLTGFVGRDIPVVPMHDHNWVCEYEKGKFKPSPVPKAQANRRDAILHFLTVDAVKIDVEQTLVVDSWTALQDAHDRQTELFPKLTKAGQVDEYDFWDQKLTYSRTVLAALKALRCHVVVTHHESRIRDPETGELKEKVQPLMQGRFAQELKRFYPNYFRCIARGEITAGPTKLGTITGAKYFWQIRTDPIFDAKCSRPLDKTILVPATFQDNFSYQQPS